MPRYRVTELQVLVGDRWLELPIASDTALTIEPPGPTVYMPGMPTGTGGRWDVGPVAGFPVSITASGRYHVVITTGDGARWCGPAFAIGYSRQLLGAGPREAC